MSKNTNSKIEDLNKILAESGFDLDALVKTIYTEDELPEGFIIYCEDKYGFDSDTDYKRIDKEWEKLCESLTIESIETPELYDGHTSSGVISILGTYIGYDYTYSSWGSSQFGDVYEVKPVEVTKIEYKPV